MTSPHSHIIQLNIGGTLYTTTKETLTKVEKSFLHEQFKNFPHVLGCPKDKDGCYFFDRDGVLFRYILNFLRSVEVGVSPSGILHLPADFKEIGQLRAEAEFFKLSYMMERIQWNSI